MCCRFQLGLQQFRGMIDVLLYPVDVLDVSNKSSIFGLRGGGGSKRNRKPKKSSILSQVINQSIKMCFIQY